MVVLADWGLLVWFGTSCLASWDFLREMDVISEVIGEMNLSGFWFQGEMESKVENSEKACGNHGGICAICLDKIVLQETALVKDCEHAYWLV